MVRQALVAEDPCQAHLVVNWCLNFFSKRLINEWIAAKGGWVRLKAIHTLIHSWIFQLHEAGLNISCFSKIGRYFYWTNFTLTLSIVWSLFCIIAIFMRFSTDCIITVFIVLLIVEGKPIRTKSSIQFDYNFLNKLHFSYSSVLSKLIYMYFISRRS